MGKYFNKLGKKTFAIFDKQEEENLEEIKNAVDHFYEGHEKGFEKIILNGTKENILRDYALSVVDAGDWPIHLQNLHSIDRNVIEELKEALKKYLYEEQRFWCSRRYFRFM